MLFSPKRVSWLLVLLLAVLVPPFAGGYLTSILVLICIWSIMSVSLNLIYGYTGQLSLGHSAFLGIGAYALGLLAVKLHLGFWPAFFAATAISGLFGFLIGIPALKLRGPYFVLVTLGFAAIIGVVVLAWVNLTGGANGLYLDSGAFNGMLTYYWVALAVATLCTLVVFFIGRSRMGLALKAIREDEISAASHGVNVLKYKVLAFSIGAFMAGVAGSIYAYYLFDLKPESMFNMNWLFYPILIVVLGGSGTVFGPVIGAFIVSFLFAYGDIYFAGYHPVVSGLLIILVMLFMPEGILGLAVKVPSLWRKSPALAEGGETAE